MTEKNLIKKCILGDRIAQKLVYEQYSRQMYGICLRYCKDQATAQDALQLGFVKVFKYIDKYRSEGNFGGWIRRIVINEALGQIRKDKIHFTHDMEVVNELDMSFEINTDTDNFNYQRMMNMLDELPMGYKTVFSMAILDEMTHKEIADTLGITENTSRSQLLRARRMMQEKITGDAYLTEQYIDNKNVSQ